MCFVALDTYSLICGLCANFSRLDTRSRATCARVFAKVWSMVVATVDAP